MRTTFQPTIGLQALNTLMFACICMWFVVQQNLLAPSPAKYGLADVAKAMHFQPRTPPPTLDPEQVDVVSEDVEAAGDLWLSH